MHTFLAVALTLLGFVPGLVRAEMLVQACFSPEGECSGHIMGAVDAASREVLVAMYAFTNVELAEALVRARGRGVEVRVILDAGFDARSHNSLGRFLVEKGVAVETVSGVPRGDQRAGLMHQKFVVVDGATVVSGSYNWTHSADAFNHESLLIFRDAGPLAGEFRAEFLRLWAERH